MATLDDMTRKWAMRVLLQEEFEPFSSDDLLLEGDLFESGTMSAQMQAIFEAMDGIRLTSNRDRNRMSLARENMKKVRRHVKKLEEKVVVLQEQVSVLEENAVKSLKKED